MEYGSTHKPQTLLLLLSFPKYPVGSRNYVGVKHGFTMGVGTVGPVRRPHSSEPSSSYRSISVHFDCHVWSSAGQGPRDRFATELLTFVSIGHLHPIMCIFEFKTFECQTNVSVNGTF